MGREFNLRWEAMWVGGQPALGGHVGREVNLRWEAMWVGRSTGAGRPCGSVSDHDAA